MKKHIFLLILVLLMAFGINAYAQNSAIGQPAQEANPAPLTSDTFTLWVDVLPPNGGLIPSTLKVELHTTEGVPITSGEARIERAGTLRIDFPVDTYEIGKEFRVIVTDGGESVIYFSDTLSMWQAFTAETYAYTDAFGNLVIHNCVHISVVPYAESWDSPEERFVNERGIKSDTDYLVWVSKANYTVSVFLKRDWGWDLIKQFDCAIGAPSTPTVTGEFTYHQYQDKWQYSGYYVGPIMRFYNGYAIHRTLVNNNGTHRDARVRCQISHGCVRVLPENARWLTDYVPLGTKIYVTND